MPGRNRGRIPQARGRQKAYIQTRRNKRIIPNEKRWKTSEAVFLDNLKKAINASGTAGTDYSAGTAAHADVVATANGDTTQVIRAKTIGTAANAIATTTTLANYAWGDTKMARQGVHGYGHPVFVKSSSSLQR